MHKVKSHKSVEQIAKKHRLEVSFVKKQLEMGIPIEHEHTKDKDLATDIALQHLDEIPDYYTRLKKMEKSAKSEHKKFKDVTEGTTSGDQGLHDWFNKSKSSDGTKGWVQLGGKWAGKPCARQPGQSSTPKCGSSKMKRNLSKEEEETARREKNRLDPNQPEKTGGAKPTNVRTEEMNLQEVKDKPGKGSGKKDACYYKVKSRYDVFPSAYASGALVRCRQVGAANWGTKSEETQMIRYCPKCKKDETRDECKYGVRFWDEYSVPSSLKGGYHPNSPHPGNFPESYDHEHSMARSELSTIVSAAKRLRKKMKGEGNIEAWVQSKITKAADYLDTAADYVDSGEMKEHVVGGPVKLKPGKGLGGGVLSYPEGEAPKKHGDKEPKLPRLQQAHYEPEGEAIYEYSNWREDFGISEDWQKVNRQDKTAGLSQKAVNAYRRENPGSNLQTAVTEKNPKGKREKRRASFCRRMKGMRSKLTSAETAKDPDSNINKALRRWRCK